jgi:MFS family permease
VRPVIRTEPDLRAARRLLCVVFFCHGAVAGSWAARIPSIKAALDLTEGELGLGLVGAAFGTMCSLPLAGAASARTGNLRVTRIGAFLFPLTLWLPAIAGSLPALFGALALLGASGAFLDVSMNAYGVDLEGRYRRPILSSLHGLWSLGAFAGASLAGIAAAAGWSPAAHLGTGALLLLALGVLAAGHLPRLGADDPGEPLPAFARPTKRLAALGAIAFCAVLGEGSAFDWSGVYLRESLGSSEALATAGLTAFALVMAAGRFVGDRLTERWGRVRLVRISSLIAAVGMAMAVVAQQPMIAVLGFALLGGGLSCIVPAMFATAGHLEGGPGIAAVGTLSYLGFFLGPPAVGGMAELIGLGGGLAVVSAGLLCVPLLLRSARNAIG